MLYIILRVHWTAPQQSNPPQSIGVCRMEVAHDPRVGQLGRIQLCAIRFTYERRYMGRYNVPCVRVIVRNEYFKGKPS